MRGTYRRVQQGTTLVETAVALVVVALMIGAVAQLITIWQGVIASIDARRDCRAALHIVRDRAATSPQAAAGESGYAVTIGRCTAEVVEVSGVDGVGRIQVRIIERMGIRTIERTIAMQTGVR